MIAPFPLGRIVATPGALKLLKEVGEDPLPYLARHQAGDWGKLDEHDRRENERSLKYGWRILSSYPVGEKNWVDHHRSLPVRHFVRFMQAPAQAFLRWHSLGSSVNVGNPPPYSVGASPLVPPLDRFVIFGHCQSNVGTSSKCAAIKANPS